MDARAALLHLWTVVVLLKATPEWADAAEIYGNTWAVQIDGGLEEANRIAREHGFINHGNVSCFSTTSCVRMQENACPVKEETGVAKNEVAHESGPSET